MDKSEKMVILFLLMFTLNNLSLCFLSPSSIPTFVFTRHKKKDFYFYSFKVVLIVRPLQQQYYSSKLSQSGDIESNPGPLMSFEELTSTLKENQNLLKIACLNVQSIQNIHDDITKPQRPQTPKHQRPTKP